MAFIRYHGPPERKSNFEALFISCRQGKIMRFIISCHDKGYMVLISALDGLEERDCGLYFWTMDHLRGDLTLMLFAFV